MKVLLCQDIEKLGWLGDILEVKDGYARNYLLPLELAKVPSEGNIKALAEEKAKRGEQRKLAFEQKQKAIQLVEGAEVVLAAKANVQGHLFGSVSRKDIAENLRGQGFDVSDDMVDLGEHIKEVGEHEVTIKAAADLIAAIKVVVVAEGEAVDSEDEQSEE